MAIFNNVIYNIHISYNVTLIFMTTIKEITLKVPDTLAEAYILATPEQKESVILKFTAILQSELEDSKKEALTRFRQTMNMMSEEAQKNGLTPEILASILNDEE